MLQEIKVIQPENWLLKDRVVSTKAHGERKRTQRLFKFVWKLGKGAELLDFLELPKLAQLFKRRYESR